MSSFSPSAMRLDISRTTCVRSASRCRWTAPSMTDSARPQFDYLIIGAGAAGCVLANRLSARQDCKVLLLEAGDDLTPGREPADIRSVFPLAAFNARYMWPDTRVHWRQVDNSPALSLPQGKILGGSSTVH